MFPFFTIRIQFSTMKISYNKVELFYFYRKKTGK